MRDKQMEQDYHWLDGYVFLHSHNSWKKVCELWSDLEVRYAGKLEHEGNDPDRIVAFVEVDRDEKDAPEKLHDRMQKVRDAANPSSSSATATAIGINGPTRWSEKKPWGAFLRIKANTGDGRPIFDWLDPSRPGAPFQPEVSYYGMALCSGDWDVLLELGADSKQALDPLIAQVTAKEVELGFGKIVSKQKNHIRRPEPPARGWCKDWDGRGSNTD